MTRRLLVATRTVNGAARDPYDELWHDLANAVRALNGAAWRFVSADEPDRFVEFIEWKQEEAAPSLPERPGPAERLQRLEHTCPSTSRELLIESRP